MRPYREIPEFNIMHLLGVEVKTFQNPVLNIPIKVVSDGVQPDLEILLFLLVEAEETNKFLELGILDRLQVIKPKVLKLSLVMLEMVLVQPEADLIEFFLDEL